MTLSKNAPAQQITETIVAREGCVDDAPSAWRVFEAHLNWINVSCKAEEVILRRQSFPYTEQIFMMYPTAVAEVDGVIVGYAATERRDLGVLEVVNLFVNDAFRSAGVGGKLLQIIEDRCVKSGFHTLLGFASDRYYPGKRLPTSLFMRAGYEVRELSPSTQMYIKPVAIEIDERISVSDTKRIIYRTILRTERVGDDEVLIFSDIEELRAEGDSVH